MTEKITDVTALACKKKFLEFFDALSKSYPPMTFECYQAADDNHINWFPRWYHQSIEMQYQTWFTLAVLNNFPFMLQIKQQHPDAIRIFNDIVNKYKDKLRYHAYDDGRIWMVPGSKLFNTARVNNSTRRSLNLNYDCNVTALINYYRVDVQLCNINKTSSAIQISNNLIVLQQQHNLINELKKKFNINEEKKEFTINELFSNDTIIESKNKCSPVVDFIYYQKKENTITRLKSDSDSLNVDEISNIYAFQVLLNSSANAEILFSCLNILPSRFYTSRKYLTRSTNINDTLSLLMENIVDVLK